MHVLKEKSTITWYVMCFVPGISTSENLFKEIERVNKHPIIANSYMTFC